MKLRLQKKHYYENRVADVEQTNPRKWWKQIKSLTGKGMQNEWYHQFLKGTKNTEFLVNRINDFFTSLTDHFQPLTPSVSSTQIPVELLVTEEEVYQSLLSIDTTKTVGPDDIPNKLRCFFFDASCIIFKLQVRTIRITFTFN